MNVEDDAVMSDLEAIKQYHDERVAALLAFEDKVEKRSNKSCFQLF